MNKSEEIKDANIQLLALLIFIGTTLVSLLLTYDRKKHLENKQSLNKKTTAVIYHINRIIITALLFVFLYLSYQDYKRTCKSKIEKTVLTNELIASIITIVAGLIVLYDSYLGILDSNNTIENPEI